MKRSEETILSAPAEHKVKLNRLFEMMVEDGIDAALISDNANIFYLTGRVFAGYILLIASSRRMLCFVRRPVGLTGGDTVYIRKPEDIPAHLAKEGIATGHVIALELDNESWNSATRLATVFQDCEIKNIDGIIRKCRAVKTKDEVELIAESGRRQTGVYKRIPSMYCPGMTDLDLQIEIEKALRMAGCLGQFRINGGSMELFMGNILTGDNADSPTPYDFAMGGSGAHPSLPVGADGSVIESGNSVMVDINGNFTGYMTDMTRVFALGKLPDIAYKAHECSRRICSELASMGHPDVEAKKMYERAVEIVREDGLEDYFMGHRQHAGFIGHGVGIEINESPVIAPRSRDVLEINNVIALEPKFVIPGCGAVGIENTYVVTSDGMHRLTDAPEEILQL